MQYLLKYLYPPNTNILSGNIDNDSEEELDLFENSPINIRSESSDLDSKEEESLYSNDNVETSDTDYEEDDYVDFLNWNLGEDDYILSDDYTEEDNPSLEEDLKYFVFDDLVDDDLVNLVDLNQLKFEESQVYQRNKSENKKVEDVRNSTQVSLNDRKLKEKVSNLLSNLDTNLYFHINSDNFDLIQYQEGQYFKCHQDYVTITSNIFRSYSMLICIQEPSEGGETVLHFSNDKVIWKCQKGSCIIFDNEIWHEGLEVLKGQKIILKIDLLGYHKTSEKDFILIEFPKENKSHKICKTLLKPYSDNYFEAALRSAGKNIKNNNVLEIRTNTYEQLLPIFNLLTNKCDILEYEDNFDIFDYYGFRNSVYDKKIQEAKKIYYNHLENNIEKPVITNYFDFGDFKQFTTVYNDKFWGKIYYTDALGIYESYYNSIMSLMETNKHFNIIPLQIFTTDDKISYTNNFRNHKEKIKMISVYNLIPIAIQDSFIKGINNADNVYKANVLRQDYDHNVEYYNFEYQEEYLTWLFGVNDCKEEVNDCNDKLLDVFDQDEYKIMKQYSLCKNINKGIGSICRLMIDINQEGREWEPFGTFPTIDEKEKCYKNYHYNVDLVQKLTNLLEEGEEDILKDFKTVIHKNVKGSYWCNQTTYYNQNINCKLCFIVIN